MDYEKAYKEALERAREIYHRGYYVSGDIEHIFPELAESKDEKIRKELIEHIKANHEADFVLFQKFSEEEIISWLEKQGKKPQGKTALEAIKEEKVESKFHEGDFIVNKDGNAYKVVDVCDVIEKEYHLRRLSDNGFVQVSVSVVDRQSRLWNITKDAKDGDVLVASDGSIFLFAGVVDLGCQYYIALELEDKTMQINDNFEHCWESVNGVTPATKEQRNLLFQKMKEAGYMWDDEKKELRKIEQKSAEWSEKDEHWRQKAIDFMKHPDLIKATPTLAKDTIDWLKSLKDRCTWKPTDGQIKALKETCDKSWEPDGLDPLYSLYEDLEKLKGG